ncbi:protein of unknown function [Hyphomicrobium sp. 1Nfss2.1]|uniref:hypothetical protein n=1 Tax=Hyphomicrobium sp. 1Nfss2.1 TaxID=3413936 RepID=UPI003C79845A
MERDEIVRDCAQHIEDLFAQHHSGGRGARLRAIELVIRAAIHASEAHPDAPESRAPIAKAVGKDGTFDKPFSDYLKVDPDKGAD